MSAPTRSSVLRLACFLLLSLAFLAPAARAGDEPQPEPKKGEEARPTLGLRAGDGWSRAEMWRAPTAEDWKRPVQITFQRTWEDALAVAKATGKPILCCINMDGEIASEHYAGVRYRDPAIGELYKPYVCVIASVYRHNPRDYDDQGRRILCPRFGGVTCGEHISIEPLLYEKFLDGQRVAPRHIMVGPDGKEVFDLFYINDTATVFDALRDSLDKVPPPKPDVVRGDRPILDRVASRDVADREAVEKAYEDGDADLKRKLLAQAAESGGQAPVDLLRLGVHGLDVDLAKEARAALTHTTAPEATELISEALQQPIEQGERDALIGALKRLGESSTLARWLAGVHEGLGGGASRLDPSAWSKEGASGSGAYPASPTPAGGLDAQAEARLRAAYENPKDPQPRLEFAESTLKLALETRRTYATNPNMGERIARHLYADAERAGLEAEKLGATGWRLDAVVGLAAYYGGNPQEGYTRSEAAMKDLPPGDGSWMSYAIVTVYAESRWKAIKAKVRANEQWPPQWLTDLHAAYGVLQQHPLGTDDQVVWHYEFLRWLGAERKAGSVLREGLQRFHTSDALHDRLRERMLRLRGPDGLLEAYAQLAADRTEEAQAISMWYGEADVAAADQWRRNGQPAKALAAYTHAIAQFETALAAGRMDKDEGSAAIGLALSSRARVAFEQGDDGQAVADMLACFARCPDCVGTRDGVGMKPWETAEAIHAHLLKTGPAETAAQLRAAIDAIDPDLRVPDAP